MNVAQPAAIQNIKVAWDAAGDHVTNLHFVRTWTDGAGAGHVFATRSGSVRPGDGFRQLDVDGSAGASLRNGILAIANAQSSAIAGVGSQADASFVNSYWDPTHRPTINDGEFAIAIDREGTAQDQVIRGRLDTKLPAPINALLDAAKSASSTLLTHD